MQTVSLTKQNMLLECGSEVGIKASAKLINVNVKKIRKDIEHQTN